METLSYRALLRQNDLMRRLAKSQRSTRRSNYSPDRRFRSIHMTFVTFQEWA
jgi:hypothetical protein